MPLLEAYTKGKVQGDELPRALPFAQQHREPKKPPARSPPCSQTPEPASPALTPTSLSPGTAILIWLTWPPSAVRDLALVGTTRPTLTKSTMTSNGAPLASPFSSSPLPPLLPAAAAAVPVPVAGAAAAPLLWPAAPAAPGVPAACCCFSGFAGAAVVMMPIADMMSATKRNKSSTRGFCRSKEGQQAPL